MAEQQQMDAVSTLDKVSSNRKLGSRAKQLLHLVQSDHPTLVLVPAYAPRSGPDCEVVA